MRLTLKSVQEQAASSGVNVEKTSKGYSVNGQTFRLLAEVVNYLNTCLETPVTPDLTVNEVQQVVAQMGFLVQPMAEGYGIFFESELLGVAKLLSEVMQVLPEYKEAITRYYEEQTNVAIAQVEPVRTEDDVTFIDIDGFYNFEAQVIGEVVAEVSHDSFNDEKPWYVSVSGIEVYRNSLWCEATDWVKSQYVAGTLPLHQPQQIQVLATRTERAATIEVLEQHGSEFVVHNCENDHHYVVCPNHLEPNQRCECADCHYRGVKCKHQIAVENFLGQRLKSAIVAVSRQELLNKPFDELTHEEWKQLRECAAPIESTKLVAA